MNNDFQGIMTLLNGSLNAGILASKVLADVARLDDLQVIFHKLCVSTLLDGNWITRTNASVAILELSSRFCSTLKPLLMTAKSSGFLYQYEEYDIESVIRDGKLLYSDELSVLDTDNIYGSDWLNRQRRLLQRRLGKETSEIDASIGLKFSVLDNLLEVKDVVLVADTLCISNKKRISEEGVDEEDSIQQNEITEADILGEVWFARLLRFMLVGLVDPRWETRHGCSIGLKAFLTGLFPLLSNSIVNRFTEPNKIKNSHSNGTNSSNRVDSDNYNIIENICNENIPCNLASLPMFLVQDIACSCLSVLVLDRFIDVSTSTTSIAPVKESCAQLLATAVITSRSVKFSASLFNIALAMSRSQSHWTAMYGGLLALKYLLPVMETPTVDWLNQVQDVIKNALRSSVDDVICAAAQLIQSLTYMTRRSIRSADKAMACALMTGVPDLASECANCLSRVDDMTGAIPEISLALASCCSILTMGHSVILANPVERVAYASGLRKILETVLVMLEVVPSVVMTCDMRERFYRGITQTFTHMYSIITLTTPITTMTDVNTTHNGFSVINSITISEWRDLLTLSIKFLCRLMIYVIKEPVAVTRPESLATKEEQDEPFLVSRSIEKGDSNCNQQLKCVDTPLPDFDSLETVLSTVVDNINGIMHRIVVYSRIDDIHSDMGSRSSQTDTDLWVETRVTMSECISQLVWQLLQWVSCDEITSKCTSTDPDSPPVGAAVTSSSSNSTSRAKKNKAKASCPSPPHPHSESSPLSSPVHSILRQIDMACRAVFTGDSTWAESKLQASEYSAMVMMLLVRKCMLLLAHDLPASPTHSLSSCRNGTDGNGQQETVTAVVGVMVTKLLKPLSTLLQRLLKAVQSDTKGTENGGFISRNMTIVPKYSFVIQGGSRPSKTSASEELFGRLLVLLRIAIGLVSSVSYTLINLKNVLSEGISQLKETLFILHQSMIFILQNDKNMNSTSTCRQMKACKLLLDYFHSVSSLDVANLSELVLNANNETENFSYAIFSFFLAEALSVRIRSALVLHPDAPPALLIAEVPALLLTNDDAVSKVRQQRCTLLWPTVAKLLGPDVYFQHLFPFQTLFPQRDQQAIEPLGASAAIRIHLFTAGLNACKASTNFQMAFLSSGLNTVSMLVAIIECSVFGKINLTELVEGVALCHNLLSDFTNSFHQRREGLVAIGGSLSNILRNKIVSPQYRATAARIVRLLSSSLEAQLLQWSRKDGFLLWLSLAVAGMGDAESVVRTESVAALRVLVPLIALAVTGSESSQTAADSSLPLAKEIFTAEDKSVAVLQTLLETGQTPMLESCPADATLLKKLRDLTGLGPPSSVPGGLRQYQWEGVCWLTAMRRCGFGTLLADEMGLGKTIQTLTAIALMELEAQDRNSHSGTRGLRGLVVCPASLTSHWAAETQKFFPASLLQTSIYKTPERKLKCDDGFIVSDDISESEDVIEHESEAGCHLTAISYSLFRTKPEMLFQTHWDVVVVDECHSCGNPNSQLSDAVRDIHAGFRIALSGTPVQNQVKEIWSIFQFLLPDYLGDLEKFRRGFINPITKAFKAQERLSHIETGDKKRPKSAYEVPAVGVERLRCLHKQILPFMLRRTKDAVLVELPPKTVTDIQCPLTAEQRNLYATFQKGLRLSDERLEEELRAVLSRAGGGGAVRSSAESSGQRFGQAMVSSAAVHPLQALRYLSLLAVHPALVVGSGHRAYRNRLLQNSRCSGKLLAIARLLLETNIVEPVECEGSFWLDVFSDDQGRGQNAAATDDSDSDSGQEQQSEQPKKKRKITPKRNSTSSTSNSARPTLPLNILTVKSTHKCLIFAHHRAVLDILESCVFRRYFPSVPIATLDGSVPPAVRAETVRLFNSGYSQEEPEGNSNLPPRILLMTTGACGLGLNLTSADTVVFIEHNWNPVVDLQAADRAHRIGQKLPVTVYRLLAQSTVEERIMGLQDRKKVVATEIIDGRVDSATVGEKTGSRLASALTSSLAPPHGQKLGGVNKVDAQEATMDTGSYESLSVDAFLTSLGLE